MNKQKLINIGSAIVIATSMLFGYFSLRQGEQQFQKNLATLSDELTRVTGEFNEQKRLADETSELVLKTSLKNSNDVGSEIADLQNQYRPSMRDSEYAEVTDALKKHFKKDDVSLGAQPWFQNYSKSRADLHWSYVTTYGFNGDTAPMIWLCRDVSTNEVFAYAMAEYNVNGKLVSDLSIKSTFVGQKDTGVVETDSPDNDMNTEETDSEGNPV